MSPYIEGCLENVVLTNLKIVESKAHALSCLSIRSFLFSMSAFLYLTNRMNMSYGEAVDLSTSEKRLHTFKVLCEWPLAREQLKLENMYDPELGTHLGHKLWTNQQFSALKVYKNIGSKSGAILEKILEWDGTLDEFSMETSTHFPIFSDNNLDSIEKELLCSAKNHYNSKKHGYVIKLLNQASGNDISGIQHEKSSSPEYNIVFQKYKAMTLNVFLDIYQLPKNLKEQSSGRNFLFLHSLNPDTLPSEVVGSLDCANSFWNLPDIKTQLTKFIDSWAYDRNFNNQYSFGFVDCPLELMWIRERMLAAKNMNATKQIIFWDKINLRSKSQMRWFFNQVKEKPSVILNILHRTVQ